MLLSLYHDVPAGSSDSHFARFDGERVLEKLRALEALPDLGWAAGVAVEAERIRRDIKEAHNAPLRFLLWTGTGGAAEDKHLYNAAGLLRKGPRCYVLDSADPLKLKSVLEDIGRRHGLAMTAVLRSTLVAAQTADLTAYQPVVNLEKLAALYDKYRIDSRPNFLAIAPPGSRLDRFARQCGYRQAVLGPGELNASRHGGPLTRGSLYSLVLAKVDLKSWIAGASLTDAQTRTAWRLASFLHAQAEAGRDNLTLLLPKQWSGAGAWTRHCFEESLDPGLKVVVGERPKLAHYRAPKDPRQDRAFLAVLVSGAPGPDPGKIGLLRRSGYPVAVLTFPRAASLAAYMQFMHRVAFGVAYLRGKDSSAGTGTELSTRIADRVYAEAQAKGGIQQTGAWQSMVRSPRQAAFSDSLTLHYDRLGLEIAPGALSAPQLYAAFLRSLVQQGTVRYGELAFFGDTRYSRPGAALRKRLCRAAEELFGARLKMPADVSEGPAALLGRGRCFSTVLLSAKQEQAPAARHSADYHVAQFLAAQAALAERNRPLVAIVLKDLEESALNAAGEFFHRAASALKRPAVS